MLTSNMEQCKQDPSKRESKAEHEPMRSCYRQHAAWAPKVLERDKAEEVFEGGKGDDETMGERWDGGWGLSQAGY